MDTTTVGFEAEPAEAETVAEAILAEIDEGLAGLTDPLTRYLELTSTQVFQDAVRRAVVSGLRRRRGAELRCMADDGSTYEQIAEATRLGSKQRVSQLIAPAP